MSAHSCDTITFFQNKSNSWKLDRSTIAIWRSFSLKSRLLFNYTWLLFFFSLSLLIKNINFPLPYNHNAPFPLLSELAPWSSTSLMCKYGKVFSWPFCNIPSWIHLRKHLKRASKPFSHIWEFRCLLIEIQVRAIRGVMEMKLPIVQRCFCVWDCLRYAVESTTVHCTSQTETMHKPQQLNFISPFGHRAMSVSSVCVSVCVRCACTDIRQIQIKKNPFRQSKRDI